jgi:hypothetical protein
MSKDSGAKILQAETGLSYQRCVQLLRSHWEEVEQIKQEKQVSSFEAIKLFGQALKETK